MPTSTFIKAYLEDEVGNVVVPIVAVESAEICDGAVTIEKISSSAIDSVPSLNSIKLITSGGVKAYVMKVIEQISDGTLPAGIALDLFSPTDIEQTNQSFIFRTSGSSSSRLSIRSGEAILKKVKGNYTPATNTSPESYSTEYHETPTVIVDSQLFFQGITAAGLSLRMPLFFIKTDTGWFLNELKSSARIPLTNEELTTVYGITLIGANPQNGEDICIILSNSGTEIMEIATLDLTKSSETLHNRLNVTIDLATFKATHTTGTSFSYTAKTNSSGILRWIDETAQIIISDISSLGITVTASEGNLIYNGDKITINYTRANYGTITQSTPTSFKAVGFNSFKNTNVLNGYKIQNGTIVADANSMLGYVKCARNPQNPSYTVFDQNNTLTGAGWCATTPSTGATVTGGTGDAQLQHVTFSQDGYVVFSCTDVSGICVHCTWSGSRDRIYEPYTESVINLPAKEYYAVGTYRNVLDLSAKTFTKNVTRIAYTPEALTALLAQHTDWVNGTHYMHDNNYIYHIITPTTETVQMNGLYTVNDYSTEEFVGTLVAPYSEHIYGENLVDKLRVDVITDSMLVGLTAVTDSGEVLNFKVVNVTSNN